jgi:hypothetical protein
MNSAVDLDGFDLEGHVGCNLVEEVSCGRCRCPVARLGDGPFCDGASREVDVDGVDLHDAAGLAGVDNLRFSASVGAFVLSRRVSGALSEVRHGVDDAVCDELCDNAPDGRAVRS